ncbi:hypothetical protein B0T12DRAFT_424433 [Alternaria alternata]|nr:hypothetical protein B0T12DRAFT_424433 [Alternaria alternata]
MTRLVIPLELLFVAFADAVSIPSTRNNNNNNNTSDSVQLGWSRQDILTLIGVCIAVVGVLAAVLVSSPGLRERLCTPFEFCVITIYRRRIKKRNDARRRLQKEYEDYVRFKEFLDLVGAAGHI